MSDAIVAQDRLHEFLREECAVSATEYAILLALIVLVSMAAIQSIGSRMINLYTAIDGSLPEGF